jgi:DNA-binding response OmpR family regulator
MKPTKFTTGRGEKSIRQQVETLKRQKLSENKIVNLSDFRQLKKSHEARPILVVDDDEVMRNAMKRILDDEGYQVLMAEDGMELSKILETTRLELILLDVNLPWVDGLELCRIIKGHTEMSKVPLLLVSARKTKEDIEAGFQAGCDDYLTKPFDVDRMIAAIRKQLPPLEA